jgi:hypothetical protein
MLQIVPVKSLILAMSRRDKYFHKLKPENLRYQHNLRENFNNGIQVG